MTHPFENESFLHVFQVQLPPVLRLRKSGFSFRIFVPAVAIKISSPSSKAIRLGSNGNESSYFFVSTSGKFSLMISRSLIFFSPLNKLHFSEHSLSPKSSSLRKLTLRVSNNKTGEVSVRGLRFTEVSHLYFWEMIMGSREKQIDPRSIRNIFYLFKSG